MPKSKRKGYKEIGKKLEEIGERWKIRTRYEEAREKRV